MRLASSCFQQLLSSRLFTLLVDVLRCDCRQSPFENLSAPSDVSSTCYSTHFQVLGDVVAGVLELVLVEDDVEHVGGALRQLLRRHHLHRQVLRLPLPSGLDQPLEDLQYAT